jgi:hypothetical protein
LVVELEHLKTKTRLKDEKFASVKGECETWTRLAIHQYGSVVYYKSRKRDGVYPSGCSLIKYFWDWAFQNTPSKIFLTYPVLNQLMFFVQ